MSHPLPLAVAFTALLAASTFIHDEAGSLSSQGPVATAPGAPDRHDRSFVPGAPEGVTAAIVRAAEELREALPEPLAARLVFARDDEEQRARWSNLPTGIVERRGVRMGDLSEAQRAKVFGLLATVLSPPGVQAVRDNMLGDEVLPTPGGNIVFGDEEYYVALVGAPSLVEPWAIQFGGHHLALNATIVGERVVLAPSLTGGQPMRFEHEGRQVLQMAAELDAAYALVASLDEAQRGRAVRGERHIDLSWGPGRERPEDRRAMPPAEGLAAKDMTDAQRALLRALVRERIALLNAEDAAARMAELDAELGEMTFAWYGSLARDGAATYRVQGPSLLLEFAPQGAGPGAAQHVHAIYRDPTNEYGRALARR